MQRSRYLRNEHFKSEALKLDIWATSRELDKLFTTAKRQTTTLKSLNNSSSCPPDETLNYFKRHFNHGNNADRSGELDDVPDFVESLRKLSSTIDINNEFIHSLRGTRDISEFIQLQQSHYTAHVIRVPSERSLKQLMFNDDACKRRGRLHKRCILHFWHWKGFENPKL